MSTHVELSIRQIANETRLGRDTVAQTLDEAGIEPAGQRGGHATYRLRDVLDALYSDERQDPEAMPPLLRDAWYRGEDRRMKVAEARGELCHAQLVYELANGVTTAVSDKMLSLPARRSHEIAAEVGAEIGTVSAALERAIREELDEAAEDAMAFYNRFVEKNGGTLHARND